MTLKKRSLLKKIKNFIINLSSTNTVVSINNIKSNPKFFYSAGMLSLQKIGQPKAIMTILRTSLLKSKIYKTKPVAVHFNNLFFNYQSYIFKKIKQKILKNHKKKKKLNIKIMFKHCSILTMCQ
jgi:hypothetical protein